MCQPPVSVRMPGVFVSQKRCAPLRGSRHALQPFADGTVPRTGEAEEQIDRDGPLAPLQGRNHLHAAAHPLCKAAKLTQEQVSARLQLRGDDVSHSIYSQIECGIHNVRVDELFALKQIFGVPYEDIFAPIEQELDDRSDL